MRQVFSTDTNYRLVIRSLLRIHQLWLEGKGESAEAEAIRDAMDLPWQLVSEVERKRLRGLSEDLNSISIPPHQRLVADMNPQAQAKVLEAAEARNTGELDRALELLRRWGKHVAPALLSYLRGSVWFAAGDAETALVFFEDAVQADPNNPMLRTVLLERLKAADPSKAVAEAEKVLADPETQAPDLVVHAAQTIYGSAQHETPAEALTKCNRLVPIVERVLQRFKQDAETDTLAVFVALVLLAGCHRACGDTDSALTYYSRALQMDPSNAVLLAVRGILLYGSSSHAIADFELAIRLGSPVVWPYFFLAHHFVTHDRFEDSRSMCERGLSFTCPPRVKSELLSWLAISQAELGFPHDLVRATFENAVRSDPSNDRARNNFSVFEAAERGNQPKALAWEQASVSVVRAVGEEEARVAHDLVQRGAA